MKIITAFIILTVCSQNAFSMARNNAITGKNRLIGRTYQAAKDGLEFLYKNQLPYGEFKSYACPDKSAKKGCEPDSSLFFTTFVAYSINFAYGIKTKGMTERALNFFLQERSDWWTWQFYSSKNNRRLVPDVDDTSCVSYLLLKNDIFFKPNSSFITRNKNEDGTFNTWIMEKKVKDVDSTVNCNVLLYLGQNDLTADTCQYLNNLVSNNKESSSYRYYLDDYSFYYMLSRAYFNGVSCLEKSKGKIIERISMSFKRTKSFPNTLAAAFTACTLFNFGAQDSELSRNAIEYILKHQNHMGFWEKVPLFKAPTKRPTTSWWASEELTTAICVEALARYYSHLTGKKINF